MELLDCGHEYDPGMPVNVAGKTILGYQFVLIGKRKVCHACADKRILDCGHHPSPHSLITTGYGTDVNGKKICWECCHKRDLESLKTDDKLFAYWSETNMVTNWPGGVLGVVISYWPVRNNFCGHLYHLKVRDAYDQMWYGKGAGRGVYVKLRKCKKEK